jgi:hypothetical protein
MVVLARAMIGNLWANCLINASHKSMTDQRLTSARRFIVQIRFIRPAALALFVALAPVSFAEKLNFVAIGDMPYTIPGDYAKFERLLAAINAAKPSFTVFIGDVKGGSVPCTDETINKVADYFKLLENPLIFTPGDNEWTDCHRHEPGQDADEARASERGCEIQQVY